MRNRQIVAALVLLLGTPTLQAADAVLPAVVYQNNLFTHYRATHLRRNPYVISVRPLDNYAIRVVVDSGIRPRNDFESLFVRGDTLAFGGNHYREGTTGGGPGISLDSLMYFSPSRLREAHLVALDRDGKPMTPRPILGRLPSLWTRFTELPIFGGLPPSTSDIRHTAVAAVGDRDVLVFDLIRTVPAAGKAESPLRLAVTRVIPDFTKPEEKPVEEMAASFSEPFQAYLVGDDYFFLTRSGSVYRSSPPPKGQPRKITVVWDDQKARVRFVISDGNRSGIHLLIVPHEKGWGYFRLGANPRPQVLTATRDESDPGEEVFELAGRLKDKKEIMVKR